MEKKAIMIANHISTWDPVLLHYAFPFKKISFMTASILFSYSKIFSWYLRKLGAFPVDRHNTDLNGLSLGMEALEKNRALCMFPEGKRSLDGTMLPFKPGVIMLALNSNAPIYPMYISGKYGLFRRMTLVFGERIMLSDYCEDKHPSQEKIKELCEMLHSKVLELKDRVPSK